MPYFQCYSLTNPDVQWNYCPSFSAAVALCTLFGLVLTFHITQATLYKKPFAAVIIMAAAWEFIGFIFRILAVQHQLSAASQTTQQLLILLAPLWINAFVYMTVGRMIHFFLPKNDDSIFSIRARKTTLVFVLFDILSFMIQATGGIMLVPTASTSTQHAGLRVYMGGVGIQLFFIACFLALTIVFHRKLMTQEKYDAEHGAARRIADHKAPVHGYTLLYVVYATLLLITYRNIYRLVEFSAGVLSDITTQEWYFYIFDAAPMLLALVLLSLFHPGRYLKGERCDFSEENQAIKQAKREIKALKKILKNGVDSEEAAVKTVEY